MAERIGTIRLGTRGSALARWQTEYVRARLQAAWPELDAQIEVIQTQGDRVLDTPLPLIGGKGVFTAELEQALRDGRIDIAVHSLKDLPTDDPDGLIIGAISERADVRDVLVSRGGHTLDTLPEDATVGTSSHRRGAQIRYHRPDLQIADIRGNVDTRIRKALDPDGPYDAIVLAAAGLDRLGMDDVINEHLSLDTMLPAPGQGALAVQCRSNAESLRLLAPLNHPPTAVAVAAERAFLAGLGGGCSLPIAAHATLESMTLKLRGRVTAPDGSEQIDVTLYGDGTLESARATGTQLAQIALGQGVARLLEMHP